MRRSWVKKWSWLVFTVVAGAVLYRKRASLRQIHANIRAFDLPNAGMYDALVASLLGGLYARVAGEVATACPRGTVLEVGSGPGRLAIRLARAAPGVGVIGVDLSPAMVELATRRVAEAGLDGRVRFVVGDVGALPLPEGGFDGAVSTLSLHQPGRGEPVRRRDRRGGTLAGARTGVHPPALAAE